MATYFYDETNNTWLNASTIAEAVNAVISSDTDTDTTIGVYDGDQKPNPYTAPNGVYYPGSNGETISHTGSSTSAVTINVPRIDLNNINNANSFSIVGPTGDSGSLKISFYFTGNNRTNKWTDQFRSRISKTIVVSNNVILSLESDYNYANDYVPITNSGAFNISNGASVSITGQFKNQDSGSLTVDKSSFEADRYWYDYNNAGTGFLTISNHSTFTVDQFFVDKRINSLTVEISESTFTVTGNSGNTHPGVIAGDPAMWIQKSTITVNSSTLQVGSTDANDVFTGGTLQNDGTITVTDSTVRTGAVTNTGTFNVNDGSTLTVESDFSNSKTVRINTSDTTIRGGLTNTAGTFTVTTPGYLAVVLDEDLSGATVTVKKDSKNWKYTNVSGASGSTVYLYGASASTKPSAPYDFLKGDTYSVRINSGTWSDTDAAVPSDNKFEVNGAVDVSGGTLAITNIDFKAGTTQETIFTGSSVSNAGMLTVTNSTFDSGAVSNDGTLTVTASTVHTGDVTKTGTLTVTASTVHTGAVTNDGTLTVDATSHLTASSITINGGTLKFYYDPADLNHIQVTGTEGNRINIADVGTITIDVSKFYQQYDGSAKFAADFLVKKEQKDQIVLVDGANTVTDIIATIGDVEDGWGKIKIGPKQEKPKILFVNAKWEDTTEGKPTSAKYKGADYFLNYTATNDAPYVNAFCSLQAAIDAAKVYGNNCTIVFYRPSSGSSSLDFLSQGAITVVTSAIFDTNMTTEAIAVKIDSLHIESGVIAEFRNGYYSMEDFIDNDGTMKISDHARFNANVIGNDGHKSKILVDSTSRLTADANEEGDIQIEIIGGAGDMINGRDPWIIRPVGSITDDPEVDIIVPDSTETKTFIDVRSGDKLVRDSDGIYYIDRDGKYNSYLPGEGDPTEGAPSGTLTVWDFTDQYKGLYLVSDVFDLRKTGNDESDPYWSNTIYVDASFSTETTSPFMFETENGKTVKATYCVGTETSMPEPTADTGVYAFSSFVDAYNSKYTANHKIGTTNQGVVIRLRGGSSVATEYNETGKQLNKTAQNDVIVEPDKTDGEHYDKVSLILSGMTSGNLARLMEFSHFESLTIGNSSASGWDYNNTELNWSFGSGSADGNRESSLLTFVNIGTLTINSTLKAQYSATIRIINCADVVSNKHLSVVGGTLIIDSSNITLAGAHSDYGSFKEKYGVLSTENNSNGTGNLIVRNSTFRVKGTQTVAQGLYVNLKGGSEFMIEGMSTVSGVFTNANDSSDTTITFSNAMLDENTDIQGYDGYGDKGAALKFEGYNVLDGSHVAQMGNRNMTIDAGATVNMTDGASISVGGGVNVQNCGSISLNDSTITAGSFDNTGSLTLSDGATIDLGNGTFTNQVNGTVTVDLQYDPANGGTIGITAGGGIVNNGLILIDLSHTDYPEGALQIDLNGLSNSKTGELRVIGGGGEVKETTDETHQLYVQLAVPKMQTLYVNGEWDPDFNEDQAGWGKGKNVGSYMYYGYNSFRDNPTSDPNPGADAFRSLTFSGDTDKVVYVGGNGTAYGDLSIPDTIVRTITVGEGDAAVTYLRCTEKDESGQYYAWTDQVNGNSVVYTDAVSPVINTTTIYSNFKQTTDSVGAGPTETQITVNGKTYLRHSDKDITAGTPYYAWKLENGTAVVYTAGETPEEGDDVFAYTDSFKDKEVTVGGRTFLDSLTLSTLNSSMTTKLTFDVPGSFLVSDKSVKLSVVVKDSQNNIVDEQTISVPAGSADYYTSAIFSNKLDSGSEYKVVISNGSTTSEPITAFLTPLSDDRSTAEMKSLTVKGGQTVTLSGATMSLVGATDGVDSTITNSGTVNVGTGESAKLELAVAKAKTYRDVKVRISSVGFEEYHTVSVAPNTDTIVVRSDSLIVGDYNVFVTDTLQCSYESDYLRVDVKNVEVSSPQTNEARRVKIVARNADGLKYIYGTNGQLMVPNGQSYIGLKTPTFNDNNNDDNNNFVITGDNPGFDVSYDDGKLKLIVSSGSEQVVLGEATIINVSGTGTALYDNGSGSQSVCNVQFEYSFRLDAGQYGADWKSAPVDPALTDKGYYYVEVEEAKVVAKATEDSITGSAVKAENVTNSGTLTIASQKDFPDGVPSSKSAKLVLDVDKNESSDRWVTVTEGEGPTAKHYSMYVAAGKSTADLASKMFSVGEEKTVTIEDVFTRTIKVEEGNDGKLIVDGLIAGSVNDGNSGRTLRISYKIGSTETTTVSPEVVIGEDGKVTLENMGTVGTEYIVTVEDTRTVSNVEAQTLVEFTAAAVTNEAGKHIEVTDATFVAGTVTNEASAVITVDNSRFTVTGTLVNKDKTNEEGSTPGSISLSDSTFVAGTVTNNGTFTVSGESELTIGKKDGQGSVVGALTGQITVSSGAKLKDSSIISAANHAGTISAGNLNFIGTTNALENGIVLTSTGTVTNEAGTLSINASTVSATSLTNSANASISVTASTVSATSITNTAATAENAHSTITITNSTVSATESFTNNDSITMDVNSLIKAYSLTNGQTASVSIAVDNTFTGMKLVIDQDTGSKDANIVLKDTSSAGKKKSLVYHNSDYWVADVDQSTVYVNSAWAWKVDQETVYSYGETIGTKKYYGYNAFDDVTDAVAVATGSTTTGIEFTGDYDLSDTTISVTNQSITVATEKTLTIDAASSITAGSITGEISLSTADVASASETLVSVTGTEANLSNVTLKVGTATVDDESYLENIGIEVDDTQKTFTLIKAAKDIYLSTQNRNTLYLNSGWTGYSTTTPTGYKFGDKISGTEYIYGYNAFDLVDNALNKIATNTTDISFTSDYDLSDTTISVANQAITVDGTLTINAATSISASSMSGTICLTTSSDVASVSTPLVSVTGNDANLDNVTLQVKVGDTTTTVTNFQEGIGITVGEESQTFTLVKESKTIYLSTENRTTLYVNADYNEGNADGHVYGYNAFDDVTDAVAVATATGSTTTGIEFTGDYDLSDTTISVTNQAITVATGKTLTINAATRLSAASMSGTMSLSTAAATVTSGTSIVRVTGENANLSSVTLKVGSQTVASGTYLEGITFGEDTTKYTLVKAAKDIYLSTENKSTLYVSADYGNVFGTITEGNHIVGYNAFSTAAAAISAIGSTTTGIEFTGDYNLSNTTISVTNQSITVATGKTLTMNVNSLITASSLTNNGTITIDASSFAVGQKKLVIDLANDVTVGAANIEVTGNSIARLSYDDENHDYYVICAERASVYVNSDWSSYAEGASITYGSLTLVKGYNAFDSLVTALEIAQSESEIGEICLVNASDSSSSYVLKDKTFSQSVALNTAGTASATGTITFTGSGTGINLTPAANKTITIGENVTFGLVGGTNTLKVTNSGTIAVSGSATLNASSITGGELDAKTDGLTFTGANELTGVTLTATNKTVTVDGDDNTLTVDGTSTLKIGKLVGDIMTAADATLKDSTVNKGSVTALGNLKFSGANELSGIELNAVGKSVALANSSSSLSVANSTVRAQSFSTNSGQFLIKGVTTLDISSLTGTMTVKANGVLKDSHIAGGRIDASEKGLRFSGANTLNNLMLNAIGKSVAFVDTDSTLTVTGTNMLKIGSRTDSKIEGGLTGTITLGTNNASTTLLLTTIIGAVDGDGKSLGTLNAVNSLRFTGTNTLSNITLTAAGQSVTVNSESSFTMDVNCLVTADSFTNNGKFTIDARSFAGGMKKVIDLTGSNISVGGNTVGVSGNSNAKLIYDADNSDYWIVDSDQSMLYVDSHWTDANYKYGDMVDEGKYYGYNAFGSVVDALKVASAEPDPSVEIQVESGAYDSAIYFGNLAATVLQPENGTVSFSKNVYAGTKNVCSDGSTSLTIESGTYQFVSGGGLVSLETANSVAAVAGDVHLTISGGKFGNYVVAGADKVTKGDFTRDGSVYLTISGGTFGKNVGGGILLSSEDGCVELKQDIYVTITGGVFAAGTWLYGGNFAGKKDVSCSGRTMLDGSTHITVNNRSVDENGDVTYGKITLGNIVAGSHGHGTVGGNTELVFTGRSVDEVSGKALLSISGELWGGCSADYYKTESGKRVLESLVDGSRTLSFTGFVGALDCARIRGFSDIEFRSLVEENPDADATVVQSAVTLAHEDKDYGFYDLSEIANWTFENGSTLDGNFINDFAGDTLNLTGFGSAVEGVTLITDLDSGDACDVFNGFDSQSGIRICMNGHDVGDLSWSQDGASVSWAADSVDHLWLGGSLSLNSIDDKKVALQISLVNPNA